MNRLMNFLGTVAEAPLNWAGSAWRAYENHVPKPIRFVLLPVQTVVCITVCALLLIWCLPFAALDYMVRVYAAFK